MCSHTHIFWELSSLNGEILQKILCSLNKIMWFSEENLGLDFCAWMYQTRRPSLVSDNNKKCQWWLQLLIHQSRGFCTPFAKFAYSLRHYARQYKQLSRGGPTLGVQLQPLFNFTVLLSPFTLLLEDYSKLHILLCIIIFLTKPYCWCSTRMQICIRWHKITYALLQRELLGHRRKCTLS